MPWNYLIKLSNLKKQKIFFRFIARRLELADVEFKAIDYQDELDEFVRDYIRMDGIFVLKMLTIHAGILLCTEIVDDMWEEYRENTSLYFNLIKFINIWGVESNHQL